MNQRPTRCGPDTDGGACLRRARGLRGTDAERGAGAGGDGGVGTAAAPRGAARGRGRGIQAPLYPVLPIGLDLPDFSLPGVDGKRHAPKEFKGAKVLAVMFESNHCPASLAYQERVHELLRQIPAVTALRSWPINPEQSQGRPVERTRATRT